MRFYSVIYELIDEVRQMLSGMLAPARNEKVLGSAEILEVFNIGKVGRVAGCRVTDGTVRRGANARLMRDSVIIHDGSLSTLKRFKEEVKEVREGNECGMAFENYQDFQLGDAIEIYEIEEVARSI
jgi:translation initiation factor IF-2